MYSKLRVSALAIIGSVSLAGCAGGGLEMFGGGASSDVTTSSVGQAQAQRVDPACGNLAVEIDTLRREGVADKIDRAAAKKYKMTSADLGKASQLNKANGEFQAKCSTLPRTASAADATAAGAAKAAAPAVKAAAPAAKAAGATSATATR